MGTKNRPGRFDYYANAEPDEPMFVLLGRDKDAPALVDAWADRRQIRREDPSKVREARECAQAMRKFRAERVARSIEREAPWMVENFGLTMADAKMFLAVVDGDRGKAAHLADLAKKTGLGVDAVVAFLGAAR